jgi:hypothetical protein
MFRKLLKDTHTHENISVTIFMLEINDQESERQF